MTNQNVVREELLAALRGGHAHMSLDRAVEEFPFDQRNEHLPGVNYTAWHVLEHIRIAQWDILTFIRDPDHVSPDWPDDYWPAEDAEADEGQWQETVRQIREDRQAMIALVEDPDRDPTAPLPHAEDYNLVREVLTLIQHCSYHIGEFILFGNILSR
jgi:hypothetical protein